MGAEAAVARTRRRRRGLLNKVFGCPYVLIAPAVILIAVFSIQPLFFVLQKSFRNFDMVQGIDRFIGLANYRSIFTNPLFLQALGNTFVYMLCTVGFGIVFGVLFGLFLNKRGGMFDLTQSVIFTPHIISYVSISVMWMWVLDPRAGMANYLLQSLGLPTSMWMRGEESSLFSVMIVALWKGLGYTSLIVIAGLQNIPPYIYESARLDRSRGFNLLGRIILPLLSPTLFFLLVTGVIGSFGTFDIINLMTVGGPNNSSNLLVHWIYQTGFQFFRMGPAMAASVVYLAIIAVISLLNFTVFGKKVHYQ